MPRYILSTPKEAELADAINAAFEPAPDKVLAAQPTAAPVEIGVALRAPHAERASLSLRFDGKSVLLKDRLARNPEHAMSVVLPMLAAKQLELRIEADNRTYNLEAYVPAVADNHAIEIDYWAPDAPPRVRFDGVEINRGPGLRLRQAKELPALTARPYSVFLIEEGIDTLDLPEPVDIYIDDRPIEAFVPFTVDRTLPVRHHAKLTLGLHRIVVVSRRRGWVLVDTDIVVDGVNEVRVHWKRPSLSRAEVRVTAGAHELFRGLRDDASFRDGVGSIGYLLDRIVINGVDIPKGLEPYEDKIKRAKAFSEAMVANYRAFLEAKRAVKVKKDRGEPLTEDERKIDEIDSYSKMEEWVRKRKEAEGYKIKQAGKTDPGGKSTDLTPPATDPFEELQKKVTNEVHEPSHVAGNEQAARGLGLDWEKLKKFFAALKRVFALMDAGKTEGEARADLTPEERDAYDWGMNANKAKIDDYLKKIDDPFGGAEEEIQEYEAEIRFYEEVLKKLQEERDKAANPPVPEQYLSLVVRYFHAIRESFKDMPEAEKERMRSQLRALKAQVRDSTKLTPEEKQRLIQLIDETLAALG